MLTKDNLDARRKVEGIVFPVLFALTIPAANWLIGNVGTKCVPNGPCLIPVAPGGLVAPSGVTMIGIALGPQYVDVRYPIWQAVPLGIRRAAETIVMFAGGLREEETRTG